jgi:BASS family bile acid:Na+ symporter
MFGLGTGVDVDQVRALRDTPRAGAVGLAGQLVGMPLLALLAARLFGLGGELGLGFVLLAACPGGIVSNVYSALARADVALSVSLTAASTVLAAWTLPLWLGLLGGAVAGEALVDPWELALRTLGLSVLPVAAGVAVRARRPQLAGRLRAPVRVALVGAIALLLVGSIAQNGQALPGAAAALLPAIAVLNLGGLALGGLLGLAARLPAPQRLTVALEVGLQNAPMAMGLALVLDGASALPAVLYGPWMLISGGALAWAAGHFRRRAT